MPSMTKRVNVYAQVAIRNVNPPIYGTCKDIVMTTGDILKCLCKRARVEEILPDGKIVRLNMRNYYIDNGAGLDASKSVTKEAVKVENPARFKVPVVPIKEQVVETKTIEDLKHDVDNLLETNAEIASFNGDEEPANPADIMESNNESPTEISNETEDASVVDNEEVVENENETTEEVVHNSNNNNQHHNKKKHKK